MTKTEYDTYLQSPWWRKRRDRAIRAAHYRCSKCSSKNRIEVHHLSYMHLGAEEDRDLEVLCHDCHEGHHFEQSLEDAKWITLYTRIGATLLGAQWYETHADFEDALVERCAGLSIAVDRGLIRRAVTALSPRAFRNISPNTPKPVTPDEITQPIGREEAADICRRLGLVVSMRSMSTVRSSALTDAEANARSLQLRTELWRHILDDQ